MWKREREVRWERNAWSQSRQERIIYTTPLGSVEEPTHLWKQLGNTDRERNPGVSPQYKEIFKKLFQTKFGKYLSESYWAQAKHFRKVLKATKGMERDSLRKLCKKVLRTVPSIFESTFKDPEVCDSKRETAQSSSARLEEKSLPRWGRLLSDTRKRFLRWRLGKPLPRRPHGSPLSLWTPSPEEETAFSRAQGKPAFKPRGLADLGSSPMRGLRAYTACSCHSISLKGSC